MSNNFVAIMYIDYISLCARAADSQAYIYIYIYNVYDSMRW